MDKFEAAKTIPAVEVLHRYTSLKTTRRGRNEWACCPFHSEKTPSCAFDISGKGEWYCQGCHAGGTSIDFVAMYFDLSTRDAAMKICADYGLQTDDEQPLNPLTRRELDAAKKVREAKAREAEELELRRIRFETIVCAAKRKLESYKAELEQKERDSDEPFSEEFVNTIKQLSILQELSMKLLEVEGEELKGLMDNYASMLPAWQAIGKVTK